MSTEKSIQELLDMIPAGSSVFVPGSTAEPVELTSFIEAEDSVANNLHFITSFVPGINPRNLANKSAKRTMDVFFMQPSYGENLKQGLISFRPISFLSIQRYLATESTKIDWTVCQVSPPNEQGECSLGPSAEFLPTVLSRNCRALAVINPNIPFVKNSPKVALSRFDAYAHSNLALPSYSAGTSNDTSEKIAANIAGLIPNGATLQVGLGKIPALLLSALEDHKELGIHSGMVSDSIIPLLAAGALREENPITSTVAVGSEQLYQFLQQSTDITLSGVEHTHSPVTLAQLPKLYAINSALEVDLHGQVNAEMLKGRYVSAPGGLPDFANAARRQADGLSIIALPATDPKGKFSRIVTNFAPGTPVAVPQFDVDAVVTEFGVAMLRGKDITERKRQLISVAHPDFRSALEQTK